MIDNLARAEQEIDRLWEAIRKLQTATPLASASVERGRLRMYGGSELLIEDSNLTVSGTAEVTGTLNVDGTQNLAGDLNVTSGGKIKAGPVTIDLLGPSGGRIWSSGQMIVKGTTVYLDGSTTANGNLGVVGNINVTGSQTVFGSKSFRMDHPTKPGWWIQHGSTESPISGTEYTGTGKFNALGKCVVILPDYFEAVNKQGNRSVQVTVVGQPFMVGADRISAGKFTVHGTAGREFDWLVKAERFGGDFDTESKKSKED